jgi:tRNA (mo5U34)-methyltransferase
VASLAAMPDLAERAQALDWYHTLDLPGGVTTSGHFDTRGAVRHVPLPADLTGKRVLEIGTWDGFWAFELERRGAQSVTAIDLDDPAGWDWPPRVHATAARHGGIEYLDRFKRGSAAFELAHEALDSRVERRNLSVYDLDPEVHGRFDLVFLGTLLLHLRDPVGALARIRSVCAGDFVVCDAIELIPSLLRPRTPTARLEAVDQPWWWQPNVAAFHRMLVSAGFRITHRSRPYFIPLGPSHPVPPLREVARSWRTPEGREALIIRFAGIPHVAARAVPLDGDRG